MKVIVKDKGKTLINGKDYTLVYDEIQEGNARMLIQGKDVRFEQKVVTFAAKSIQITQAKVKLDQDSYEYTGKPVIPGISSIMVGDVTLDDRNYEIAYEDNTEHGKGYVVLTGKGLYTGTLKVPFIIRPMDLSKSEVVQLTLQKEVVALQSKNAEVPFQITYQNEKLVIGLDFTVEYKHNRKVALATSRRAPMVIVTGKGNYCGKLSAKYTIVAADSTVGQESEGEWNTQN